MNTLVLVLLLAAVVLAAVEAVRSRSLGWAGFACLALALVIASGGVRIADS